jgi:hypothetical protein
VFRHRCLGGRRSTTISNWVMQISVRIWHRSTMVLPVSLCLHRTGGSAFRSARISLANGRVVLSPHNFHLSVCYEPRAIIAPDYNLQRKDETKFASATETKLVQKEVHVWGHLRTGDSGGEKILVQPGALGAEPPPVAAPGPV